MTREWAGDSEPRDGDDPLATYHNGSYLVHVGPMLYPYVMNPLVDSVGMLVDHAPSHPHHVHGSVIVNHAQWDTIGIFVGHDDDASTGPIVIVSRDPRRTPYVDATQNMVTRQFVRVPRIPGTFWTFFDDRYVADRDAAMRCMFKLLPHPGGSA